jgi:hypothetical protein
MPVSSIEVVNPAAAYSDLARTVSLFYYRHPHAYTGELPLGQHLPPDLVQTTAITLGAVASGREQRALGYWAEAWQEGQGKIEAVGGKLLTPDFGYGSMSGPPVGRLAPLLHCFVEYDSRGPRGLDISMALVDSATDRRVRSSRTSFNLTKRQLNSLSLERPDTWEPQILALASLAHQANDILSAAQDPLKPALRGIFHSKINDPAEAAKLTWITSTRATTDENAVEACFMPVDPDLYGRTAEGRQRYIVAVRDAINRKGPVLLFYDSEWVAFTGGAKAGEFDL